MQGTRLAQDRGHGTGRGLDLQSPLDPLSCAPSASQGWTWWGHSRLRVVMAAMYRRPRGRGRTGHIAIQQLGISGRGRAPICFLPSLPFPAFLGAAEPHTGSVLGRASIRQAPGVQMHTVTVMQLLMCGLRCQGCTPSLSMQPWVRWECTPRPRQPQGNS